MLTVEEPAFLISVPESAHVFPGERVSVACAAFGSPAPVITWNSSSLGIVDLGAVVDQSVNVYVEAVFLSSSGYILSVLEFCSFKDSYAADYMCTVANNANGILLGEASAMFTLETSEWECLVPNSWLIVYYYSCILLLLVCDKCSIRELTVTAYSHV